MFRSITTLMHNRGILKTPKIVRRFNSDAKGVTAIEFAILAGPFFLLFMGIIECSLHFFAGQRLEAAVDTVGRQVRVGILDNTATEEDFKNAICENANILFDCNSINVDMKVVADYNALGGIPKPVDGEVDPDAYGFDSPGPQQIVMITAQYEWPVFTNYMEKYLSNLNNKKALITAVSIFRTEPYTSVASGT